MPTRRGVRVALLVEDEALDRFAYRVLLVLGFHRREIRVERSPRGQGSAKQWVSQRFASEVRAQRRKASSQKVALVVGTDADELEVIERGRELDSALENAGLDPRESKEQICLLIPRWHIETWILHLSGHNVDESQSYKKDARAKAVDFDRIAEEFVARYRDWKQGASDKPTLPAMLAAFEEIRRLNL